MRTKMIPAKDVVYDDVLVDVQLQNKRTLVTGVVTDIFLGRDMYSLHFTIDDNVVTRGYAPDEKVRIRVS